MTATVLAIRGAYRRSDRVLKDRCHLSSAQLEIMQVIADKPNSTQIEISKESDVDLTTTGRLLNRFHKAGWINLTPRDGRTKIAVLTEQGRKKLKMVHLTITEMEREAAGSLGLERIPELTRVLDAFAKNIA